MSGELAMSGAQVHEAGRDVLKFWFEETPAELHFAKDEGFDAAIRDRFADLRDRVAATMAAGWDETPDTLLAAVIVLDQFSRNLFRGQPEAFAADGIARGLTRIAMRHRWDEGMAGDRQAFLYMPLMHSEDMADQDESVRLFTDHQLTDNIKYAIAHRDVIVRFGRFPSRNAALGRTSTPAEEAYLNQPGAGW